MGIRTAPLVMLRNPVDRFISNFYFVKNNIMWKDTKMISQNLSQFLDDYESMMESRCIWHDGQVRIGSYSLCVDVNKMMSCCSEINLQKKTVVAKEIAI